MPTLSKPQLSEPLIWGVIQFERDLNSMREKVLYKLGFYREHDRPDSFNGKFALQVHTHEDEVLNEIAGALKHAAAVAARVSDSALIATLKSIRRHPNLVFNNRLIGAAVWILAENYQRQKEKPGTFWPDIIGELPENFRGRLRKPKPTNIAAAASRSLKKLQGARALGQPRNFANEVLGKKLGQIFLRYNDRITRHSVETAAKNGLYYLKDSGPFFDFTQLVLEPLQSFLRVNKLRSVSASGVFKHVRPLTQ